MGWTEQTAGSDGERSFENCNFTALNLFPSSSSSLARACLPCFVEREATPQIVVFLQLPHSLYRVLQFRSGGLD